MSATSVSDPGTSSVCMSDLSARALTEDAEGCSRLRAVIASDPNYASRVQEVQSGRAVPFAATAVVEHAETRRDGHADGEDRACLTATPVPGPAGRVLPAPVAAALSPIAAAAASMLALAFGPESLSALTLRLPTS